MTPWTGGSRVSRGRPGLVIFGVTGDLSRKKLMPAVYDLANRGLLPPGFSLVGFARRDWEHEDFAQVVHDAVKEHARTPFREEVWQQLAEGCRFVPGQLRRRRGVRDAQGDHRGARQGPRHRRQLRLLPVRAAEVLPQGRPAAEEARAVRRRRRAPGGAPSSRSRSGTTWSSAQELNRIVHEVFPPDEVFRIDHYLGKETVQNILALRFANTMFEPLWNRSYVDHVQITMAEDIGIGGRAGYYDGIGAARDVIQNHLLQLLALTAMEEPASFDAKALVAEKLKVLRRGPAAQGPGQAHRARPVRGGLAGRREGASATSRRTASTPSRRPTPTPRSSWRSTTAAGRASRSTCAPASAWAAGSPRSRWSSSAPRTPPSTPPTPRSWGRTPWSSGCSRTRA